MQQAKITVSSEIRQGGDTTCWEEIFSGTYTERDGWCYAHYEETATSGMAGSSVTLKWRALQAVLLRHGAYSLRQEFERGSCCSGEYRTPYLTLPLETRTRDVKIRRDGQVWYLELRYELSHGTGKPNRIRLRVRVEPEEPEKECS